MYVGLSPILVFTGRNDFNGIYAFNEGERFIPGLTSMVKEAMQNRDYEFLGRLFGLLNLRYIVYNSEIYEDGNLKKVGERIISEYNDFQSKDNIERLVKEISNKRIGEFGPISIYELSSKYYYPTIYSTTETILCNREAFAPLTLKYMKYPSITKHSESFRDGKPVLLFAGQNKEKVKVEVEGKGKEEPKIIFKKINPTKYLVKVEGAKTPFWLVFSESFHKQWRIYNKGKVEVKEKVEKKEASHTMRFTPKNIKYLFRKPLDAQHQLVNGYANGWYVEPNKLGLGEDFTLVIYFWPQTLFYIGLGISGATFLGCLIYLTYSGLKSKKCRGKSQTFI